MSRRTDFGWDYPPGVTGNEPEIAGDPDCSICGYPLSEHGDCYRSTWVIECRGEAREVYIVSAVSEEEARKMFEDGNVPAPWLTECETEIISIEREGET